MNRRNTVSGSGLVQQAVPRGLDGARADKAESRGTQVQRGRRASCPRPQRAHWVHVGRFCNCARASPGQQLRLPRPGWQEPLAWGGWSSAGQNVCLCGASHGGELTGVNDSGLSLVELGWTEPIPEPSRCPGSILYALGNAK